MTKKMEEFIKEIQFYSKEEIIKAIATCSLQDPIFKIKANLFRQKSINIDALIDAAFKDWSKANKEYIDFLKELELKYGKGLKVIKDNELEKLNQLKQAEALADNHLQTLYKEQDKLYERV